MTTDTLAPPTTRAPDPTTADPRLLGFACRNCGRPEPARAGLCLPACFGPLDVALRPRGRRRSTSIARRSSARPPGIWRYLELLPGRRAGRPRAGRRLDAARRGRPPRAAPRHRAAPGSRTTPGTRRSRSRIARSRSRRPRVPSSSGSRPSPAPRPATSPARRPPPPRRSGCRPTSSSPPTSSPAKIDHALAYGATVVPIDGTYDDVNRLCLEVADETGWGFVNVNLRPYYAEGSKTLAFEVAEPLGWRTPGRHRRAHRLRRAVHEAREGLRGARRRRPDRATGRSDSSAGRRPAARPVARAWASGGEVEPVRTPDTFVRSLAIGSPADGRYALELARGDRRLRSRRVADDETAAGDPRRGAARGHLRRDGRRRDPRRRGGGPSARRDPRRRRGRGARDGERPEDPDARRLGAEAEPARAGGPGLAPVIPPSLRAFESWLEGRA